MIAQVMMGAVRAQARLTRQNVEDLRPILTMPLVALISLAVLVHAGKSELAPYGLVAAVLMTAGQMGNFVASEIVFQERNEQTLELAVASPAPYFFVLLARVLVLTTLGLVGALESWLIARLVFGLYIPLYHPLLAASTLVFASIAAAGTALLTTSLFALGTQVRTFQNAINGPLYLLGGVLVPVSYLPTWLQPLSPLVFFSWAGELLRAALAPEPPSGVATGLLAILALGIGTGLLAMLFLRRMLDTLRRQGTLGLT